MPSHCCYWCYPDEVQVWNATEQASGMFNVQKPSLNLFFLPQKTYSWDFVLKSEGFEAIFDLLNLLLKWHSHFCSLFPFFFFPRARNNPAWHNLWSILTGFYEAQDPLWRLVVVARRADLRSLGDSAPCLICVYQSKGRLFFFFFWYRLIVANVLERPH